jgi:hypothetical protein
LLVLWIATIWGYTTTLVQNCNAATAGETAKPSTTQPTNLLLNPDFVEGPKNWWINPPGSAQVSLIKPQGAQFKSGVRLELKPQPDKVAWNVIAGQRIQSPLRLGDHLEFSVWGRSEQPSRVQVFVEQVAAPYTKSFGKSLQLEPEWKEFRVKGICLQPFKADEAQLSLYLGEASGAIELTGFALIPDTAAVPPVPEEGPPSLTTLASPFATIAADGAAALNVLVNGDFARGAEGWESVLDAGRSRISILRLQASPYAHAVRYFALPRVSDPSWALWMRLAVPSAIESGDQLVLRCWLRSLDRAPVDMLLVDAEKEGDPVAARNLRQTSEQWQEVELRTTAKSAYRTGQLFVTFHLGRGKGDIDITGVRLYRLERQ